MPSSFNGIGTHYYGKCDYDAEGFYVTTEWAVFLYFPLFPLSSVRLKRSAAMDAANPNKAAVVHLVRNQMPVFWPQAIRVYSFCLFCMLWFVLTIGFFFDYLKLAAREDESMLTGVMYLTMTFPWMLLIAIRMVERRRLGRVGVGMK